MQKQFAAAPQVAISVRLRWRHLEPGSVRRRVAWALYRYPMDTADSPGAAYDDGTCEIALALAAAPHPPCPRARH